MQRSARRTAGCFCAHTRIRVAPEGRDRRGFKVSRCGETARGFSVGEGRDRRGLKVSRCGEAARGFSVVHGRVRRGLEVSRRGARQGLRRGRRQGSSWVESEHILRVHRGSSLGERACAGAREKSAGQAQALPLGRAPGTAHTGSGRRRRSALERAAQRAQHLSECGARAGA